MIIPVVTILEVQWGVPSPQARTFFRINPENHTGAVLYGLLGHQNMIVTNACREVVATPRDRGTPDPGRLRENLTSRAPLRLLLVCGAVARTTLQRAAYAQPEPLRTVWMPHPACRWRRAALDAAREAIRLADRGEGPMEVELSL